MRASVRREFLPYRPRVAIVDDSTRSRTTLELAFRERKFDVLSFSGAPEFRGQWLPGTVDVIVADWDLSEKAKGDDVLRDVRKHDWDVPFVLVSGKLQEDEERVDVFDGLLRMGPSRFVTRGSHGVIERICDTAEDLIERRDLGLLRLVLSLRPGALSGAEIVTSSGRVAVADQLAAIVASPNASHVAARPLVESWEQRRSKKAKS